MDKIKKAQRYQRIINQISMLIRKTPDPQARMSTITAILHNKFDHYFWTGFYHLKAEELTVCCYQGSVACLVLEKHTGVCWAAVDQQKTIIVPDVHKFAGHIACDSRSASEIVVPVWKDGEIVAVLDVDSKSRNSFDEVDAEFLEKIAELIYLLYH
ncbi:MAG: GAF domain-containing protein [Candidatus Cloacimonetes bacterium]|nr:GAF domain-containing protein [Candidatus Cloacimonadota bacterium]